jgi:hypothetical protein
MAECPDLSNPRSIDRAITDLIEAMEQYDPTHPRAMRLAAMIDGLRSFKDRAPCRGAGASYSELTLPLA